MAFSVQTHSRRIPAQGMMTTSTGVRLRVVCRCSKPQPQQTTQTASEPALPLAA